jgi:hypothetical protein
MGLRLIARLARPSRVESMDDWYRKLREQVEMYNRIADGPLRVWRQHPAECSPRSIRRGLVEPFSSGSQAALLGRSVANITATLD